MIATLHVIPLRDLVDHDEDPACWCHPRLLAVCPECEEDPTGCWRCEGRGVVALETAPDAPAIVIHNAIDGRQ